MHGSPPVREPWRAPSRIEDLLRELAPQVLGALVRRHGQFDACEDAVQEALLAAAMQWPREGVPERPAGLAADRRLPAAGRRLAQRERPPSPRGGGRGAGAGPDHATGRRDAATTRSTLLFLCCHPSLSPPSQLALTLRAVGGLTTAEIAAAFLVPEATMAQRISRAKQTHPRRRRPVRAARRTERAERLARRPARALPDLQRGLHRQLRAGAAPGRPDRRGDPADPAAAPAAARRGRGRRAARADAADRRPPGRPHRPPTGRSSRSPSRTASRWDTAQIAEGVALLTRTLGAGPVGPYQVQAAIAAVHDEAPTAERDRLAADPRPVRRARAGRRPGPVVTLNRAVAVADGRTGRAPASRCSAPSTRDERMAHTHRLDAVRAHLLEQAGDPTAARESYLRGRPDDRQPARAALPRPAGGAARTVSYLQGLPLGWEASRSTR